MMTLEEGSKRNRRHTHKAEWRKLLKEQDVDYVLRYRRKFDEAFDVSEYIGIGKEPLYRYPHIHLTSASSSSQPASQSVIQSVSHHHRHPDLQSFGSEMS